MAGKPQNQVRVLVADNHPIVRKGVAMTIRDQRDLNMVGEAEQGAQALDRMRVLHPDVALLELRMPQLDGLQVLSAAARESLSTRVLLFSAFSSGVEVHEAMVAGAAGYITKDEPTQRLCEAVRKVASDQRYLSQRAQAALLDQLQLSAGRNRTPLTERELEILRLTAEGNSSAKMGRRLSLSQSTVKNHQQHIYDKLGVSNAPAAIYQAMRRGLLE